MSKLNKRSMKRLKGVDDRLIEVIEIASENSPYAFQIAYLGGKRSVQQQRKLFEKQASKCDGVHKKSRHQSGMAVDIVCYDNEDEITWSKDVFKAVAAHILSIAENMNLSLTWGGIWKMKDLPHFEIKAV